ncbi:MAG: hypothetical protein D3914_04185, partial [Candidatus Electrothrix sp. LOE2]|nr:hypothetical protein [Candidatus Electrothrix sp. LOE2]
SAPVFDEVGSLTGLVYVAKDITQQKQLEAKIRQAQKMEAIGTLAGGIAHDFRNPLAAISGSAQILSVHIKERQKESDDPIISTNRHLTDIILRESDRMEKTINDFLQFAHPKEPDPEWFNLKRVVGDAVRQIQGKKSRYPGCIMQADIPENLDCWGDRRQMQIILVHLLENSCFASKNSAEPILVRVEEEQQEQTSLCIAVIDKGTGIADRIRDKVYPFCFRAGGQCRARTGYCPAVC